MNQKSLSNLTLEEFLNHKTLYYDKIDFSIVKNSWKILEPTLNLPFVIHIVGTNGKGTTGRFLAQYLHKMDKSVVHYSSPHIEKFNERIWIDGDDISDEKLNTLHATIIKTLPQESLEKLTYFEYTTLLALVASSNYDYIVLEAGLGGEFDATNVVNNDLSLITTIGLDHENFLGDTIEKICKTKMRSVDNTMIIGYQVEDSIVEYANDVKEAKKSNIKIKTANMNYELKQIENSMPKYLQNNLKLVIESLKYLNIDVDLKHFRDLEFKGRCEKITDNITIDVGHNPLAAAEIVKEFLPKGKKIILIYNSFEDKDYEKVLKILKPIIKQVEIIKINDKRVVNSNILIQVCDKLNIINTNFKKLDEHQDYLVFGSFLVVEEFLKIFKEMNEK